MLKLKINCHMNAMSCRKQTADFTKKAISRCWIWVHDESAQVLSIKLTVKLPSSEASEYFVEYLQNHKFPCEPLRVRSTGCKL